MPTILLLLALAAEPATPPAFVGLWHLDQTDQTMTLCLRPNGTYESSAVLAMRGWVDFNTSAGTWKVEKDGTVTLADRSGAFTFSHRWSVRAGGKELSLQVYSWWTADPEGTRAVNSQGNTGPKPVLVYSRMADHGL